ncbi:MAG: Ig-like domain-containing protein [Gammaproteobacteria bacterium]|nr:Ig-like domain-containing protein [Gammaproteobacteria bacterium]
MKSGRVTWLPSRRGGSRLVILLAVVLSALSCHDDAPEPLSPFTETVPSAQASLAEPDRAALVEFYHATGGDQWRRRGGWLSDDPIGTWHGVRVEGGRVVRLELNDNNLRGRLPKVVAELSGLRVLRLDLNRLWGRIPPEWGDLSELRELGLLSNLLSGTIPSELKRLSRLQVLELRYAGLEGPLPAWLGELTDLYELGLSGNYFDSPIPPELGNLRNLSTLYLSDAEVWGPIPPELGNLSKLRDLSLTDNHFSGPIPPELGRLAGLRRLFLSRSNLSGPIPSELGNLTDLDVLWLDDNNLAGPIPEALDNLVNLKYLFLSLNRLSGNLPPGIGGWPKLEYLHLERNGFEGGVPPEWGGLSSLRELLLGGNPELAGELPSGLTRLNLDWLDTDGSALCSPKTPEFADWLSRIAIQSAKPCGQGDLDAYLIQATQSRSGLVPLIAGRKALLRAFVTAADAVERFPDVRAHFYLNGAPAHVLDVPGKPGPVPVEVDESDAAMSVNAMVPGWVIQPGLEMVIEVDPNGEVADSVAMARRIPGEGRIEVNVTEMPAMELTLIPWVWPRDPEEEILDLMRDISAESEVFWATRTLLPVDEIDLTVHEPVFTSTNSGFEIPYEVKAIRAIEGGSGYYMALTSQVDRDNGVAGVALRGGWSAWSVFQGGTIAHELGHNLSLGHAPCGTSGDPRYPQADGSVGTFGFDFDTGMESVVHPRTRDFMSYCNPAWVGAWHFEEMVRHRQRQEGAGAEAGGAAQSKALLLWGGRDARDGLFLKPAFWVDAPYAPPPSGGSYELKGWSSSGEQLFSVRFGMVESEDGDGRAGFAFALPARAEWSDLAEVALRGPGALAVLNEDTDRPSVILRDAATGRVRAMLIDAPAAAMAASADGAASSLADGARLVAARSDGLPDPADWRPMDAGASSAAGDSGTVASITVAPALATVAVGDTVRLAATALDADSSEVDGVEFEWHSGDTLVAAVDQAGLVAALGEGSTVVTATARGVSGAAEVRAEQRPMSIVLTPEAATIEAGDTVRFAATAFDVHGSPMENVDFEWAASDTSVAWAGRSGLVFGWSAGSATVSVRTDRGVSASATVAVEGELEGERLALSRLYARLRGWEWRESGNWLTDAPLADWHGITTHQGSGKVSGVDLRANGLRGQLGPELGELTELERLELGSNAIRGHIPPEIYGLDRLWLLDLGGLGLTGRLSPGIGNLSRLILLNLDGNGLSGSIPPTIGQLTGLISLGLAYNAFEGPIPQRILDIGDLASLNLEGNRLSGEIPAGLGELRNLQSLELSRNLLTGELPPSLGRLERLREMGVADNRLAGELPPELGGLRAIERIALENNPMLRGALPSAWVERSQTLDLTVGGTEVCAPRHPGAVGWLRMNDLTFIPVCAGGEAAFAYLVQAVQSRQYPTPLVAGEDALLRVFMSTDGHADMPPVRATFHAGGRIVHTADIPAGQARIPPEIDEGDLSRSANAVVPGEVVQPGLEMVIEIDPDGTLDEGLGIPGRIPAEGRAPVDVRAVPALDLTAIPFLQADNPDSTLLERAGALEADTSVFGLADELLPVGELAVTLHEPVLTTSEFAGNLLHETELIRVVEGGDGYFMGLFGHIRSGVIGEASYIGGRSFVSLAHAGVIAHELGHAMNLRHTSCGVGGDDPNYPWRDGRTGSWGYDFATGALVPPEATDVMGYCGRQWISGYHFSIALDHRLRTEAATAPPAVAGPALLVWGGVDADGQPFLKPAFVVNAPPTLPAPGGDHRLTVLARDGRTLFSVSFDMPETSHLDGASSFVFAIPAPEGWAGAIERIMLDGPGGAAALDPETSAPAIIVRDPADGRVLGLLADPPPALLPSADGRGNSPFSGLDIAVSGGLPEVWQERR